MISELCAKCGTKFTYTLENNKLVYIEDCYCGECAEPQYCKVCGNSYTDSMLKGICQDCIDKSDEEQDRRDNSSCYSINY